MKITRKKRSFFVRGGNLKEAVEYEIMPDRIAALTYIMAGEKKSGGGKNKKNSYKKKIKPPFDGLQKKKNKNANQPRVPTHPGARVMPDLTLKKRKKKIQNPNKKKKEIT
ncbi:hypothetical protein, partial [Treponema sp. R6D11]